MFSRLIISPWNNFCKTVFLYFCSWYVNGLLNSTLLHAPMAEYLICFSYITYFERRIIWNDLGCTWAISSLNRKSKSYLFVTLLLPRDNALFTILFSVAKLIIWHFCKTRRHILRKSPFVSSKRPSDVRFGP